MAPKVLAWSALLATTTSLPSFSLSFVAPIPAPSLGQRRRTHHAAHVALGNRQARRQGRAVRRRDGLPGLSSSAPGVDAEGDGTNGDDEGLIWAENRFPGCSTVLSKVGMWRVFRCRQIARAGFWLPSFSRAHGSWCPGDGDFAVWLSLV